MIPFSEIHNPDWTSLTGVRKEYVDDASIKARTDFYRRFGSKGGRWYEWLFEGLKFPAYPKILDIGCGGADLWSRNSGRLPSGIQLVLGDSSTGILKDSRAKLKEQGVSPCMCTMDIQHLPLLDSSFDLAIAAHILYHVKNIQGAISELKRVIVPGGKVVVTTVGKYHLAEVSDILASYNTRYRGVRLAPNTALIKEIHKQLNDSFASIKISHWRETLLVPDVEAIMNFLLNTHLRPLVSENVNHFRDHLVNRIASTGPISMRTHSAVITGVNN